MNSSKVVDVQKRQRELSCLLRGQFKLARDAVVVVATVVNPSERVLIGVALNGPDHLLPHERYETRNPLRHDTCDVLEMTNLKTLPASVRSRLQRVVAN